MHSCWCRQLAATYACMQRVVGVLLLLASRSANVTKIRAPMQAAFAISLSPVCAIRASITALYASSGCIALACISRRGALFNVAVSACQLHVAQHACMCTLVCHSSDCRADSRPLLQQPSWRHHHSLAAARTPCSRCLLPSSVSTATSGHL
jgi:hypothetical protein